MTTNPPQTAADPKPSCRDPYRPFRPRWLTGATVAFVLVYWYFAFVVENIDPYEPVRWLNFIWDRVVSLLPFIPPLEISSPLVRAILNFLSPLVLAHLLVPILIGSLMGTRTAVFFLKQFYNFASTKEAREFLNRLKLAKRKRQTFRPQLQRLGLYGGSIVMFFAMMAVFVAIVDYAQPPVNNQRELFFRVLIFFLGVLWLLFIVLSLSIAQEYLDKRSPQGGSRLMRLAASARQRFILFGIITTILILFPSAWMFLFYILARSGVVTPEELIAGLVFIGLVTLITFLILFFLRPKRPLPVPVKPEELGKMRQEHALLRIGGPGRVLIQEPYYATVTESNGRFCRILGPGIQDLGAYEYIHSMLDLRQHEREGSKEFLTRDGIKVRINVGVTFRIASNDRLLDNPVLLDTIDPDVNHATRPTSQNLYPYGEIAARRAAYTKTVLDRDANTVNDWHALPLILTQTRVRRALQELRYDELFAPDDPTRQPHPALRSQVIQSARVTLRRFGVHIIDVRLGAIAPVADDVTNQHIGSWQAFWRKQAQITLAQGEAQAIEEIALARREAERVMLQAIIEAVQQAEQEQGSEVTRSIVALRVVETLDRMARRSERFAYPAGHTLIHQLENLQAALQNEVHAGGNQNPDAVPPPQVNL